MNLTDKTKEILRHVVDEAKEEKQLDQKLILQETKKQLLSLQEDISYASVVLQELKKTSRVDQQKFESLDAQLRTSQKKEAVTEIARIIEDINNRYDNLRGDEKEKVSAMTAEITKSKSSLSGLKNEVLDKANINYDEIQEKLDKKIDEEFKDKWYKKLAGPYKNYVHGKIAEAKGEKKDIDEGWLEKIKSALSDFFFGLVGTFVIGKSASDLIGEELGHYKEKLQQAGDKATDLLQNGKEELKNFTPEQLKEKEKNLRNYIVALVGKYGKSIDQPTLDRVMKRLDVRKLASDNTAETQKLFSQNWQDANVVESLFEGVSLPFYFGYELLSALQAEGVIDYGDVTYSVAGETLEYGLKGFKLFGTGIKVACGSLSMRDIDGEMKKLYNKSPDAARELIWAIMYRTQHSPIFKIAANAGELMLKSMLWPVLEAKEDIRSFGHITNGLHGHMTTAVHELEQFVKYLPEGQTVFIKDLIKDFRTEVAAFKEMNEINVIQKELTTYGHTGNMPLDEIEKAYMKRNNGMQSDFLNMLKDKKTGKFVATSEGSFMSALKSSTEQIGERVKLNIKDADMFQKGGTRINKTKSALQFRPNELHIMEDAVRYLDASKNRYAKMMNNRWYLAPLKDAFSGMKGGLLNMKESLGEWKTYFNFKRAEDFEQFMKKANYIGKQSPETLKFLIGKTPLFLVGGMALSKEGTMSDKMKSLASDLRALFPIIGPSLIIWDSANAGKLASGDPETWGQMGLGGTLIAADTYKIIRYSATHEWRKLGRYMFQPVTDIVELTKFAANATKNTIILTKDFVNVAKTKPALQLGESIWTFMRSEGRLGRLSLLAGLAVWGYFTWDYFFSSNEIDEATKNQLAKYKDNPDQLDKDIEAQWSTLKQEERNEYIRASVLRQGGFSPDKIGLLDVRYDAQQKTYTAVLPSVIPYDQVKGLKISLEDAVNRVQPATKVGIEFEGEARYYFTKELSQQYANIPATEKKAKMEEYARAMGYEDPKVILDEKTI